MSSHNSRQQIFHDVPVNIRQPVTPALVEKGQLFVVDAEQTENRRLQIMHMDRAWR
jgi:hypothetical protein